MKDAYYFPHDCNARHDPKLTALCMKWQNTGYTSFFIAIEMLREQNDYRLQAMLKPCFKLAWSVYQAMSNEEFEALFADMLTFDLLQEKDGFIFSQSLSERMQVYDNRRDALRQAGRKGGLSSAKAKLKPCSSKAQAVKESKVKESILVPPTVKEAQDYCLAEGLKVDCEDFISFYQAKGWKVGKDKMKDWKAALRRAAKWEKNIQLQETQRDDNAPYYAG